MIQSFQNPFVVCFFGHRYIDNVCAVENKLEEIVKELILQKEYVVFLVGREGEFDQIVSSVIKRAQREITDLNNIHTLVMPYVKKSYLDNEKSYNEYYDLIEISEKAAAAHPKAAISIRNKEMIDRSALCVFYVEENFGGAAKALAYAKKREKKIINIYDNNIL